jgi:hypothetical protein
LEMQAQRRSVTAHLRGAVYDIEILFESVFAFTHSHESALAEPGQFRCERKRK